MRGPPPSLVDQAQAMAHNSYLTLVLPGAGLLLSACLLAYRGVTEEEHHLPLNGFLANILIQIMPLVALKVKIFQCSDRVSLVPMVLVKTMIMHACVGVFRVASDYLLGTESTIMMVDCACCLAAFGVLKLQFGYTLNPLAWLEHKDVRNLVTLAVAAAFLTEGYFHLLPENWLTDKMRYMAQEPLQFSAVLFTAANYVDIIAFMPVVWRLYQAEGEHEDYNIGTLVSSDAKKHIQVFFMFIIGFYAWDDVVDPVLHLLHEPICLMAHAAHFVLLLDFAAFFSFQVTQPGGASSKETGEQLQGLLAPDDEDNC